MTEAVPAEGATEVQLQTDVRFTLAEADPAAVVTVSDPSGAVVDGATTVVDRVVTWSGGMLAPSTLYDAVLTHACGSDQVSWTTASDAAVYVLDLGGANWVQPATLSSALIGSFADTTLMLTPTAVGVDTITFRVGVGDSDGQDPCTVTLTTVASWQDPIFEAEIPVVQMDIAALEVELSSVILSGGISPDGSRLAGLVLRGQFDTRLLVEVVGGGPPETVCELLEPLGDTCFPCLDGSGPYCVNIRVEDIPAPTVETPLIELTEEDVLADPGCAH